VRDLERLLPRQDENARQRLQTVLSHEQVERLFAIAIRDLGPVYGLNNPWVAEHVGLSLEQRRKAADIQERLREKSQAAAESLRALPPQERVRALEGLERAVRDIRAAARQEILGLMTVKQKETFEGLAAAPAPVRAQESPGDGKALTSRRSSEP
jgi:hypothetical protein